MSSIKAKPITDAKIPGTDIPDITKAHADDPAQKRWMSRVAVTTAILATMASLASMFATNHLNQAMISVIEESDQWAFYQAKGVKLAVLESKMELLPRLKLQSEDADLTKDVANAQRYRDEQAQIKADAEKNQAAAADHRRRQKVLSNASTAFQVSIALCAVALLIKKNAFWFMAMVLGAVGAVFFVMGMLPG